MHKQSIKFWHSFVEKVCQRVEFIKCQPDASPFRFSETLCDWVPKSNCFSLFIWFKKLISRKVLLKFQNWFLSMPGFDIWYQTTVSMTYQIRKSKKKTFSFVLFINQFDFHYQDCFFFKWSYKTNSLTVFFKEVFFLKIFSSWRKILTTLYLIFCCHHFPKTHPSFWIAQQWIVKGSKKSICRDLLGINRVKNI